MTVTNANIGRVLSHIKNEMERHSPPVVTLIAQHKRDPFRVLIATKLSLRTRDEMTAKAAQRLFAKADTPRAMLALSEKEIEDLIYPVGFYRQKARTIREVCRILIDEYSEKVPDRIPELTRLPGVGRKTANLVLIEGFQKPAMCVDTHVHRISNRLGYVRTRTPDETELALRKRLPKRHWITYNALLVGFGQQICQPASPWCSKCPVSNYCPRIGVKRSR